MVTLSLFAKHVLVFLEMGDGIMNCLSGGERKRASIVCELMTSPQLLIIDVSATGIEI